MSANELPRGQEQGGKPQRPQRQAPKKPKSDWRSPLHAYLEAHRTGLRDSLRRMVQQPIGTFLTCLVMGIALALPMGVSLLLKNVERLGGSWQRAAQISVFLDLRTGQDQAEVLMSQIKVLPDVAEARWISPDDALKELQQDAGIGEALRELPQNPLPGVIAVTPKEIDKSRLDMLRSQLAEMNGVQQVQLDMQWVERLTAILKLGERFRLRPDRGAGDRPAAGDRQYHPPGHRESAYRDRGGQAGRRHRRLRAPPLPLHGRAVRPGRRYRRLGAAGLRLELA
ncbi:hypothetical protein Q3H58_003845 [Pseudomonas psychrotolerans]|nr:hypothetical protein [Pseudomonas psychrotolerans]